MAQTIELAESENSSRAPFGSEMALPPAPQSRDDFKIAIICALTSEADIVESVFDIYWNDHGRDYGKAAGDQNAYTMGMMGKHNVVLTFMPNMGSTAAASVAAGLRSSFPGIELAFVVGICGVIPVNTKTKEDIVLGDCILSTALIQYDYGSQYPGGFARKNGVEDSLGRATPEIRAFFAKLGTRRNLARLTQQTVYHLNILQRDDAGARYPGAEYDRLFEPTYIHQHQQSDVCCVKCLKYAGTCTKDCTELGCEEDHLIRRTRLGLAGSGRDAAATNPKVHLGRIGSANSVMKSGSDRDRIAEEGELIAFEMEGAGIWDQFPTIVIKSACDYADSHKNKKWQAYAAATAAACLKAFLGEWTVADPPAGPSSLLVPRSHEFHGLLSTDADSAQSRTERYSNSSTMYGRGVQHSGVGNFSVGGNLHIR